MLASYIKPQFPGEPERAGEARRAESASSIKLQIRTIDLENHMHEHSLSPREGSNTVNVVILLAFKALLLDFHGN